MTIDFNEDTGEITIEFDPRTTVVVSPPKYGQLKRLRAEREALYRDANEKLEALAKVPDPLEFNGTEGYTPDQVAEMVKDDAERRALLGRERLEAFAEINEQGLERWWRFVIVGDDSFKGLGNQAVPKDVDDWPAELLTDARESVVVPGIIDRMFNHWGKVRSRSGQKA